MRKYKNRDGFVSIEAVISMTLLMFVILLGIGFYVYMQPKIMLEKEVHTLAQKAKIQGGLTNKVSQPTNSDVDIFMKILAEQGYDTTKVELKVVTNPGKYNAIGVTPLGSTGSNYVKRSSKELIVITAKVPANNSALTAPLQFFGLVNGNDFYYVKETVLSERN